MQYDVVGSNQTHDHSKPISSNTSAQPHSRYGDSKDVPDGGPSFHRRPGLEDWRPTEDDDMQDHPRGSYRSMIWMGMGGIVLLSGVFALGVTVGQRSERMDATPALDPIAQVKVETDHHDNLMFYQTLTQPPVAPPQPVVKHVAAPVAVPRIKEAPPSKDHGKEQNKDMVKERNRPAASSTRKPSAAAESAPNNRVNRALHAVGPARSGEYTMQLGAFQSLDDATAMVASLQRRGFSPYVVSAKVAGKGVWHRVRLGRFTDQNSAQEGKQALSRAEIAGWVLRSE